jgi:hypothetical protein
MKRLLFSVLVGVVCISSFSFASVKDTLRDVEKEFDTDDLTMYTMIHVRELHQELRSSCSDDDMVAAEIRADVVLQQLDRKYTSMNDAEILRHSWAMYERIRTQHLATADSLPENRYCIVKYMMYEIQQHLRDVHLEIFEKTGITKDFGGFTVDGLYGYATKVRYLDMLINELTPYKDDL